jgi:hypothetical protein
LSLLKKPFSLRAGEPGVPSQEFAEVQRAIGRALAGPKATVMDGQTRTLRVIEVEFVR